MSREQFAYATRNAKRGLPLQDLDGYAFDLGETQLSELTIAADRITCIGQLLVQP